MSILFAHTESQWAISKHVGDELAKRAEVRTFDLYQTPYWADFKNALPFYIPKGFPVSIQSLEKKFQKKFDLVIEYSGGGQHHLTGLRKYPAPVVHCTLDEHEPVKRKFEMSIKKDFDMVLVCHKDYLHLYKDMPSVWFPPAFDPGLHRKLNLPKRYDVGFVGNLDRNIYKERVEMLEKLSKRFKVSMFHKVYGEKMVEIVNQSRIVVHQSFNHDLSTRVFDTLACGTFLLGDRVKDGMEDFFKDGIHLGLYDNYADLEEKIAYYLAHEDDREQIAAEGHREVMAKHTFGHRAEFLLKETAKLKKLSR